MNEKPNPNRDTLIEKAITNYAESGVSSRDLETRILQTVKNREEKRFHVLSYPSLRWGVPATALVVLIAVFCWNIWPVRLSVERYAGEGPLLINSVSQSVPASFASGSRVSTLDNQLRLILDKNTQVLLDRDTVIVITSPQEVQLESGRLAYRHVDKSNREFHLTTPAGMIEPIGTWFDVDWSDNRLRVQVFEGEVQFQNSQPPVRIQSRQQLVYQRGKVEILPQQGQVDSWWQNGLSVPWTTLLEGRNK